MKKINLKNDFDNLYIDFYDYKTKEKTLLESIKTSLMMQEETEKILKIRKQRNLLKNELKKEFNETNNKYQNLKKFLPNLKNIISLTEEEISELETHIRTVKTDIIEDEVEIKKEEEMRDSILKPKDYNNLINKNKKVQTSHLKSKSKEIKKVINKNLSKIDRIRNNLKVIEEKLKK